MLHLKEMMKATIATFSSVAYAWSRAFIYQFVAQNVAVLKSTNKKTSKLTLLFLIEGY
jgi:hypothetical protein